MDVPCPSLQVLTSYLDGSCSSVFYCGLFYFYFSSYYYFKFYLFILFHFDTVFSLTKKRQHLPAADVPALAEFANKCISSFLKVSGCSFHSRMAPHCETFS